MLTCILDIGFGEMQGVRNPIPKELGFTKPRGSCQLRDRAAPLKVWIKYNFRHR